MRHFSLFVCLTFLLAMLCSCQSQPTNNNANTEDGLHVVTTIYPLYDWVRQIVGENNENIFIELLMDNGVDLHSYQMTAADLMAIKGSDLFIFVGGESEEWAEDLVLEPDAPAFLNLLDAMGERALEEEIKEGMESEEHEEHATELDEHVWLSVRNASFLCESICDTLCELDADNAQQYRQNLTAYQAKLMDLDQRFQDTVDKGRVQMLVFGDRFPFRYLVEDYGLDYAAAFVGCSAETEASFDTVIYLANQVDENKLNAICTLETSDGSLAQTISNNTKNQHPALVTFQSLQAVTATEGDGSMTYLDAMEKNLAALKEALQ